VRWPDFPSVIIFYHLFKQHNIRAYLEPRVGHERPRYHPTRSWLKVQSRFSGKCKCVYWCQTVCIICLKILYCAYAYVCQTCICKSVWMCTNVILCTCYFMLCTKNLLFAKFMKIIPRKQHVDKDAKIYTKVYIQLNILTVYHIINHVYSAYGRMLTV